MQSGTLGVCLSIVAVLTYLWFRFEWQFAVGAVIATMHDLLLTVGFFSITHLEFNTTSIAAILTIVGYSLNEAVVVLDRIREMMRKYKRMRDADMIDMSINAVLPRTIMTATTVFLALASLVLFGGHVIRSFSIAMMWGIFVGTYSSIFICSPVLIYLGVRSDAEPAVSEAAKEAGAESQGERLKRLPPPQVSIVASRPAAGRTSGRAMSAPRTDGFVPGAHPIDAYGAGGFRFAGMSHRGSILALPSGIHRLGGGRAAGYRCGSPCAGLRRARRQHRTADPRHRPHVGLSGGGACAIGSRRPAFRSSRCRRAQRSALTIFCSASGDGSPPRCWPSPDGVGCRFGIWPPITFIATN